MTDGPLLGIENSRSNWELRALDRTDVVTLWRTDGPGHFIVASFLNGWHVGLYTGLDVGPGLAAPLAIRLDADPEDVADLVEQLQRTAEALQEVER